jgi:prephenate dehydrogenase/cyclohexadieny/prephenate dehydrogenase
VAAPPFERLGIIGLGLIGGSVALGARRRWPSIRITACDPAPVAREAVTQGLVEAIVESPREMSDRDLIVIATPVQMVPGLIGQLSNARVPALITDTGSTKRTVMAAAQAASGLMFVGGHPVAGSEAVGLVAARADMFDGRPWLLVSDTSHTADESREVKEAMLASFVVGLGARPEWTDAVTHDRVMAHVNQAPHVVSTALMAGAGAPQGRDDSSWQGVLDTNADFIADALVAIASKLPTSSSALTDTPAVRDIFERAKRLKSPL